MARFACMKRALISTENFAREMQSGAIVKPENIFSCKKVTEWFRGGKKNTKAITNYKQYQILYTIPKH